MKDFLKAREKLNNQFRKDEITRQELNKAMTKLRNSMDAARKGRLEKTPFGRFMNWLTTPAPLSQIIEPLKGPALKKKTVAKTAASENIGAKKGAKPQTKAKKSTANTAPPSVIGKAKPKAKRQAPKFDPTGMNLPKAKAKPKAKTKTEEKRRVPIDVQTGKPKFNAPKVSDAVRLKQEDQYKRNQETKKMEAKLKKRSDDRMKAKRRTGAK